MDTRLLLLLLTATYGGERVRSSSSSTDEDSVAASIVRYLTWKGRGDLGISRRHYSF